MKEKKDSTAKSNIYTFSEKHRPGKIANRIERHCAKEK